MQNHTPDASSFLFVAICGQEARAGDGNDPIAEGKDVCVRAGIVALRLLLFSAIFVIAIKFVRLIFILRYSSMYARAAHERCI